VGGAEVWVLGYTGRVRDVLEVALHCIVSFEADFKDGLCICMYEYRSETKQERNILIKGFRNLESIHSVNAL